MLDLVRYFVLVPVLPRPATSCCCSKLPAAAACCLCACEVPLCPVPLVVLSLETAHGKPATPHIPASPLWFSSCLLPALYSLVGPAVLPSGVAIILARAAVWRWGRRRGICELHFEMRLPSSHGSTQRLLYTAACDCMSCVQVYV
jgi:hypothetical protein|eukprot:COSAG01_NODE_7776_length_3061_cov_11.754303_1_plen_145_part_00